ncbi:MAG: hypothetical protein HWE21_08000 [Cytophagia bacterium]|nr:hypothetical protein [Cytophagia bacterium]
MENIKWTPRKVFVYGFSSLGVLMFILWLSLFLPLSKEINTQFLKSEAFRVAKEYIQADSVLIEKIGRIEEFGTRIGGSLNPNSNANLSFKVYGEKGSERVRCRLEVNEEGVWLVESLEY